MSDTLYILKAHPAEILALDLESGVIATVVDGPTGVPDGIQVDGQSGAIYWTNMGAWPQSGEAFLHADGSIERCDLSGGGHSVLVGQGAIVTPKQLQLDAEEGRLYWCDREGMAVMTSRVDGGDHRALLRTGQWPRDSGDVMRHCVGIALDKRNRHIYWTQKGPPDGGLGRIFRMGLELPPGSTADTRDDVELLIDHLPEPIDLEIDHAHGQLYWTDRGDPAVSGNSVNRADITLEGLANHKVLATGLHEGIGLALDLKRGRAFVGDLSGAIRILSISDDRMTTAHELSAPITGLAYLHSTD